MSFFDEADEPPRRAQRQEPPRRRPPSGRGRPPRDQSIQTRRAIAAVGLLLFVILAAWGISRCSAAQTENSLKDYNTSVNSLMQASNSNGQQVFAKLSGGANTSNEVQLKDELDSLATTAGKQLAQAQGLSVPDQMQTAQQNLLLTLQMRHDATAVIAGEIEPAVGTSTREAAINAIAAANSQFYASDVIYKDYVVPEIANALTSNGIAVGGANGEVINGGQVITDLGWLEPAFVATKLGTPIGGASSSSSHPFVPGLHGHSLNSVSVGGTTLGTTGSNPVAASPPPTFTLNITNGGDFNEFNVVCKVSVAGTTDSATYTIPETLKQQTTTCPVTLPSSPAAGTYQVTAEVEPVEGETNVANNSATYSITFP